ncbi:MAG: XRE family transcriptional regulator [Bacillota bacterium]|nr:XRE family transcriptional regulator [Bacillota bacterium]
MKDLNWIVSTNLKKIRQEMKLSLERFSEITGVSKAMLRQIEAGESSPTINTIWKIATGLKIPYTSIITSQEPDAVIVPKSTIEPQVDDDGRYLVYPLFPSEDGRRFEIFMLELEKGCSYYSNAHNEKTQEFITVYEGSLRIVVGSEEYEVNEFDSIRFKADKAHSYHNVGDKTARISMVIYYTF